MNRAIILGVTALAAGFATTGCQSIRDSRGYIVDQTLVSAIQPGIDNIRSVEGTLGHPTFTSQYGDPTWYYVSSTTGLQPFGRPEVKEHQVLAIEFDAAGNVISAERTGMERVVLLSPDDDETPTLGRERGFLEDLFGNIGAVGAAGMGQPGAGGR